MRTAKNGDVAFDFETGVQAASWNREVGEVGRRFEGKERVVYLGKEKV